MQVAATRSDKWRYIGFNDTWFVILGIPCVSIIIAILFFVEKGDSWMLFHRMWIGGIGFTAMYWLSIRYVMQRLRKHYNRFEHTMKRIVYVVLGILILAPLAGGLLNIFFDFVSDLIGYSRLEKPSSKFSILIAYVPCFFMVATYEAIYFYYQLKISIEERERAKQAQVRSELAGLRNQVNPHFLFNSMNTLMNIVTEDQQLAVSFLKKLSKVYRYVLENRAEQIIPLSKELDFIHSYVFLQKERFKGNLEVKIDIPEQYLEQHIIPLSLQILFENSIKHNIISRKKPLCIEVFVENGKLLVRNNLQRKEQVMDSTKVGLENIKTRYRFFTEEQVEVKENEKYFSVAIPLLLN